MSATVTGGPPQIIEVQIPGGPPGPPGPQGPPGASTLTGLTDVTGAQAPGLSPVGDQTGATQEFPLTRVVTQTDLDSLLTLIAEVKWYDLTLENGFANPADDAAPGRARLTTNNLVFLEGVLYRDPPLRPSDAGITIATLPADCSPGKGLVFMAPSTGQNPARVDVYADGRIVFQGFFFGTAEANVISLCGINYSVDTTPNPVAEMIRAML